MTSAQGPSDFSYGYDAIGNRSSATIPALVPREDGESDGGRVLLDAQMSYAPANSLNQYGNVSQANSQSVTLAGRVTDDEPVTVELSVDGGAPVSLALVQVETEPGQLEKCFSHSLDFGSDGTAARREEVIPPCGTPGTKPVHRRKFRPRSAS